MYEKDMRHVRVGKLAVSMTFHGMCVKFSKIKNKLKKLNVLSRKCTVLLCLTKYTSKPKPEEASYS